MVGVSCNILCLSEAKLYWTDSWGWNHPGFSDVATHSNDSHPFTGSAHVARRYKNTFSRTQLNSLKKCSRPVQLSKKWQLWGVLSTPCAPINQPKTAAWVMLTNTLIPSFPSPPTYTYTNTQIQKKTGAWVMHTSYLAFPGHPQLLF